MQERLKQVVDSVFPGSRRLRHHRTKVVITVSGRSQPDFTTEYNGTEIKWTVLDKQLLERSPYFQKGKKVLVKLFFNHVEADSQSVSRSTRNVDKRGRTSASSRMLGERDRDIATEQEVLGRRPIWPDMYAFMRCSKSCELGPHCWVDSEGNHHKMTREYFRIFEAHIAEHGMPATHNDVPLDLQRQLIADRQKAEQRGKQVSMSQSRMAPINITNVLPGQLQQMFARGTEIGRSTPGQPSNDTGIQQLVFAGLRDDALRMSDGSNRESETLESKLLSKKLMMWRYRRVCFWSPSTKSQRLVSSSIKVCRKGLLGTSVGARTLKLLIT